MDCPSPNSSHNSNSQAVNHISSLAATQTSRPSKYHTTQIRRTSIETYTTKINWNSHWRRAGCRSTSRGPSMCSWVMGTPRRELTTRWSPSWRLFRGNWDCTFSASVTAIPRGPETRYFSYIMGFRRNFVRPRWRAVPYFNAMGGLGQIDAKGPLGVYGAQGQNFTFTLNMGSGVRYNFNPRYAVSAGINYMHISNFYLSEPKFLKYGINVYGPMVGIDVQLNSKGHHSE